MNGKCRKCLQFKPQFSNMLIFGHKGNTIKTKCLITTTTMYGIDRISDKLLFGCL